MINFKHTYVRVSALKRVDFPIFGYPTIPQDVDSENLRIPHCLNNEKVVVI